LQLKADKKDIPGLYQIIDEHIEDLAENKIQQISKSMGIKVQQVVRLSEIVRSLEPRPGLRYGNTQDVSYITPDLIVDCVNGIFEISVNSDMLPLLSISSYYRDKALEYKDQNVKRYIESKLNSATWIIKCIEQRKNTLTLIAKAIVFRQREFFEKGARYIKPMTMKEIADELKIHESTVSRAVNGKYLQCSWGVLEIKSLFSQKMYCDTGEEISASKIKNILRSYIDGEDKHKPLSDSELANMFEREGILISRRTIAKYRGQLSIPAVSLRRKY
jgi:RNA polymerase sigma-54 factor